MINNYKPYIDRLKFSNLRPTKQRLAICKALFSKLSTFHFTVEELKKIIEKESKIKISLATLYNTVHAFKKKGYLKEIILKNNKIFFDTNTTNHHHFYDEDTNEILDINNKDISLKKIPATPKGKKIKSLEITVRIASDNQIQKK